MKALSIREAAERLGRSQHFVRLLIADGHVRAQKLRGRWYVNEASLDEWVWMGEPAPVLPDPGYVIPGRINSGRIA